MKSAFEIHNEVEGHPTPVGCGLGKLEEEIMQGDEHSLYLCIPLCHNEGRFEMSENINTTILIEEGHEPPILASEKAKTKLH